MAQITLKLFRLVKAQFICDICKVLQRLQCFHYQFSFTIHRFCMMTPIRDETDEHEQPGLCFCVTATSSSLDEVNEEHVHTYTQGPPLHSTNQRPLFAPLEPGERARPLQSTGLISGFERRRLSYGTPYAWMGSLAGHAGGTAHVSIWECVCDMVWEDPGPAKQPPWASSAALVSSFPLHTAAFL